MKYEAPQLTALDAIKAVQSKGAKAHTRHCDSLLLDLNEISCAYADWE